MLGKLFGSKSAPAAAPKPGPQLGMLALKSGKGLSGSAICASWASLFPGAPALESKGASKKDGNAVGEFASDGRTLMLAAMPMPIPAGDIDAACAVSWMWKEAAEEMKAQRGHAIALTPPGGQPVEEAMAISRLIAAAAAVGQPAGVYWGNGGQVHKPALFIDAVKSLAHDDTLPVMLWVGLRISGKSAGGPFTLTTLGLAPFGHKEIEVIDSRVGVGDLRMTTYNVAHYLLANGPVLKHGDTFGASATERFKVEHTTSRFRKDEPVIRLHM